MQFSDATYRYYRSMCEDESVRRRGMLDESRQRKRRNETTLSGNLPYFVSDVVMI